MDIIDRIQSLEEQLLQLATPRTHANTPSRTHCEVCGTEIPAARQKALAGVQNCVDCQWMKEARARRPR